MRCYVPDMLAYTMILSGAVLSVSTRVPALGVCEAAHGDESLITRLMMDPGC